MEKGGDTANEQPFPCEPISQLGAAPGYDEGLRLVSNRVRELVALLMVLVLTALLTRGSNPPVPEVPTKHSSRVTEPERKGPVHRDFVKFTFHELCRHGACSHLAPWWSLKLDGRTDPPFLMADQHRDQVIMRSVSRKVSRSEFERLLEEARPYVMLELAERKKAESSEYPGYDFRPIQVGASLAYEEPEEVEPVKVIGDWIAQDPILRVLRAELNPKRGLCR